MGRGSLGVEVVIYKNMCVTRHNECAQLISANFQKKQENSQNIYSKDCLVIVAPNIFRVELAS